MIINMLNVFQEPELSCFKRLEIGQNHQVENAYFGRMAWLGLESQRSREQLQAVLNNSIYSERVSSLREVKEAQQRSFSQH